MGLGRYFENERACRVVRVSVNRVVVDSIFAWSVVGAKLYNVDEGDIVIVRTWAVFVYLCHIEDFGLVDWDYSLKVELIPDHNKCPRTPRQSVESDFHHIIGVFVKSIVVANAEPHPIGLASS